MIRAAVLDVDGVLTYFRSAWMHLHRILGTDAWATINRDAYRAGLINYRDWALVDALLWFGVPKTWVEPPVTLRKGAVELRARTSSRICSGNWRLRGTRS
jgi:phosphoserine phosphatase